MTLKTRLSILLLSTPVLIFVVVGGLIGRASSPAGDDTFRELRVFNDVLRLVLTNYVEEVKVDRAMEGAMKGLAEGLDPDSAYLNPQQVSEVQSGASLPEGEVGLELTRQYYLRVIAARDGSPAGKAGLQTGDYVRAIDGKPTRDMSVFEGTRLLRGQPGSKVTLTVIRGNAADPHEVALVREKAAAAVVSGKIAAPDVGYVRITSFREGVVDQLKKQIADLSRAGAKSIIIDVRHTAEGPLDNGIAAARLFVKSGTLAMKGQREPGQPAENTITSRDGNGRTRQESNDASKTKPSSEPAPANRETISAQAGDGAIDLPVQVLITTGTAGASEIFAAALDGNKRADLVGERTLGRAALQKLVKLPENRGLWLTYARYLTPSGESIQGKGLKPDVEVEDNDVADFGQVASDKDPILDAALARAGKKAA
ncbi:MAG TPA: S41 family peptidase [Vicinamibacterales bacterium]|jgi:carboxyl-terminal processing protease|nr:S41 family peptidase [Vicinamibacterales bacterium]